MKSLVLLERILPASSRVGELPVERCMHAPMPGIRHVGWSQERCAWMWMQLGTSQPVHLLWNILLVIQKIPDYFLLKSLVNCGSGFFSYASFTVLHYSDTQETISLMLERCISWVKSTFNINRCVLCVCASLRLRERGKPGEQKGIIVEKSFWAGKCARHCKCFGCRIVHVISDSVYHLLGIVVDTVGYSDNGPALALPNHAHCHLVDNFLSKPSRKLKLSHCILYSAGFFALALSDSGKQISISLPTRCLLFPFSRLKFDFQYCFFTCDLGYDHSS